MTAELHELEHWEERIRARVDEFGLSCFPQEFEICDHNQMLGYMTYSGMPSHYPHWSYGKSFEKLKTLYDYGVSGLPYEMVINTNPSIAYLMRDNSLLLQILTIAHVYGHNDFFRNNSTFKHTRPEYTVSAFKTRAARVRSYVEDPSIGIDDVEYVLDAAHALSFQCQRNMAIRHLSPEEQQQRVLESEEDAKSTDRSEDVEGIDLHRIPLLPEQNLLFFIRDHNPRLSEWQKDLLTIAHEEALYFIPQMETKIMNEGWATFWHKRILDSLELSTELQLEFIVRHNQVVRPIPGDLNPYHLGLKVWEMLAEGCGEDLSEMFLTREADRDVSFLRRHLSEELIRELNLFEYGERSDDLVIQEVADEKGWEQIKQTLINSVGTSSIPVIKIVDSDHGNEHCLYMIHEYDGRDLKLDYAEKTMGYVARLWRGKVALETVINGRKSLLEFHEDEFTAKTI